MSITVEGTPGDIVKACARLAERAGARSWELGWACPHLPEAEYEERHHCDDITWTATAEYSMGPIAETAETPHEAALALAVRLMDGAACRCGRDVTLSKNSSSKLCRWKLEGDRWNPGCDAPPLDSAARGDYLGMVAALGGGNRQQRRAAARLAKRARRGR